VPTSRLDENSLPLEKATRTPEDAAITDAAAQLMESSLVRLYAGLHVERYTDSLPDSTGRSERG